MASNHTPGNSGRSTPENIRQRRVMARRQATSPERSGIQNSSVSRTNARNASAPVSAQNRNIQRSVSTGTSQHNSMSGTAHISDTTDGFRTKSNPSAADRWANISPEKRAAMHAAQNERLRSDLKSKSEFLPSQSRNSKNTSADHFSAEHTQTMHTKSPHLKKRSEAQHGSKIKSKMPLGKKKSGSKKKSSGKKSISNLKPIAALQNYMAHWPEYSKKKKALSIVIAVAAVLIIAFLLFSLYELITTPKLNTDNFSYIQGTQILDKDGNAYQSLETAEYREIVTIDQIPEHVKNAFVDIEDQRFYSHHGVDFKGLTKAVFSMIFSGSLDGPGGSTITQQLIKQTHLSSEKTLDRKYHEIVLALELEGKYSKDQILEAYLNKINLAQAWGIQAAAKTYFNANVGDLSLAQAAILAAMPKSPNYYDPYVYDDDGNITKEADGRCVLSEENKTRAIIVLDKMLELGHITQTERDEAAAQIEANNVGLTYVPHTNTYSYFTEALYSELIDDLMDQKQMTEDDAIEYLMNGGLIVYSTVDQEVQTAMETAAADDSLFPSQTSAAAAASAALSADTGEEVNYIPQVAMTVIDNSTGAVAGMVGGRTKDSNLTLNRATRRFQPGSATKPLTAYAPGIDTGAITLATLFDDAAINYGGWTPRNDGGGYSGRMTVRNGLVKSLNTIAVQACLQTGIETCASYAEKAGLYINRENDGDLNLAALALGGYTEGQSTLAMASAFSSFANKGVHKSYSYYTKVTDTSGNIILEEKTTETQVYSEQTAYLMTDAMIQCIHGGTTTIYCDQPIAGKTGTTDNQRHAWICGYTPYYSMAVWYGYDDNIVETSQGTFELNIGIYGAYKPGPASMFQTVMQAINNNKEPASFNEQPEGITTATIDTISGKLATNLSSASGNTRTEMFKEGTVPTEYDDSHYTAKICADSGLLAGPNCTNVTESIFYRAPSVFPNGITGNSASSKLAPTETCTMNHTLQNLINQITDDTGTGTGTTP